MRLLLLLIPMFLLNGCEEEPIYPPPADLLPEEVYLNVLTDVHLFNALVQSADSVANEDSLRLALYDFYKVSEDRFLTSHSYYQSQPMAQNIRLDSVSNRLKRSLEALNETQNKANSSGDSNPVFQ